MKRKVIDLVKDLSELSAEDKEILKEILGTSDPAPIKKRKQSRKSAHQPEPQTPQRRKPTKVSDGGRPIVRERKPYDNDKGAPARSESVQLGKRENRYNIRETERHQSAAEVKALKKTKKLDDAAKASYRRQAMENREIDYVEAYCSRCDSKFRDVPSVLCYKDEGVLIFVCDDCNNNFMSH